MPLKDLQYYLTVIPAALIAISFHEMSHAGAAYLLGDRTAKSEGRLSFNPISHIDPLGLLCMIFFGFGWAKPVPVNPYYFKNRRLGMALTAAAGPLCNFVLGAVSVFIYVVIVFAQPGRLLLSLGQFFSVLGSLSIGLGFFNLLPVPPLDGSKVLFLFLPGRIINWFYRYDGYIRLALLLCLWFGLLDGIIGAGQRFLLNGVINLAIRICVFVGLA